MVLFLWISSGPNFPHSFLHFYRFLVLITLLSFSFFLHVAGHKVEPTVCFVVAVTIACFWCETGLQRARTKHRVSPYWTRCNTVHSGCCRFSTYSAKRNTTALSLCFLWACSTNLKNVLRLSAAWIAHQPEGHLSSD